MKIVIIDYGAGNTMSVQFAFDRIGVQTILTNDASTIKGSDGVIFPGVGHAKPAMEMLRKTGLDKVIPEIRQPFLGICLGMQLMCSQTQEGHQKGLNIFDCDVKRFNKDQKVPQVGWNTVVNDSNPLFDGIEDVMYAYFVHSYYVPMNVDTIATSTYGVQFSTAMAKNNFYGCQFHPEKSGEMGEKILKNFIEICELYQQ